MPHRSVVACSSAPSGLPRQVASLHSLACFRVPGFGRGPESICAPRPWKKLREDSVSSGVTNELLSVTEALSLRRRVVDAEAARALAEQEREALLGDIDLARGDDLEPLFVAIAARCLDAELRPAIRAALRAAFDAGWDAKRVRDEMLLAQANATAAERTRERDDAQLKRDIAARLVLAAVRNQETLAHCYAEASASQAAVLGSMERIRIAAGLPEAYDVADYEAGILDRLSGASTGPAR